MPRLDRLPEIMRNTLLTLPVPVNAGAPFTPLRRPLAQCRVTIVTTAGLHRREDHPFGPGDPSYRAIPSATRDAEIIQSHFSIGFDRTPALRDINIVFPIDRLRELTQRGEIGSLAPNFYSFMGAQRDTTRIQQESAPDLARRLVAEEVDVALITPT